VSPSVSVSPSISPSISPSQSPSTPPLITGTTTWGHDTGVLEANVRDFTGNWSGTGAITGTGDSERVELESGEYLEGEVVITGGLTVELLQNTYAAGDTVTLKYRHGVDYDTCIAASYVTYTAPFLSDGYVQIRLEATI
jgi:hypothetical protein